MSKTRISKRRNEKQYISSITFWMLSELFSVGRAFLRVPNLFAILMSLMLPPSCSSYLYFVVFNKKTQSIRQYIFVLLSVFFDRFFLQKNP